MKVETEPAWPRADEEKFAVSLLSNDKIPEAKVS